MKIYKFIEILKINENLEIHENQKIRASLEIYEKFGNLFFYFLKNF